MVRTNAPYLIWETSLVLDFEGSYSVQSVYAHHFNAKLISAARREERDESGAVTRELGVVVLHDRGYVADEPQVTIGVVVVRRLGEVTPVPEVCGEFLGTFATSHGRWTWLVFQARSVAQPTTEAGRPGARGPSPSPSSRTVSVPARTRPAPPPSAPEASAPASPPPPPGPLW